MKEEIHNEIDRLAADGLNMDDIPELLSIEAERFGFTISDDGTILTDSSVRARYIANIHQESMALNTSMRNLDLGNFSKEKDNPNKASPSDPFDATGLSRDVLLTHFLDSKGKSIKNSKKCIKPTYLLLTVDDFKSENIWLERGLTNILADRIDLDAEARIILALNSIITVEQASKKNYDLITLPMAMENSTPQDIKDILGEAKKISLVKPLHAECRKLSMKYRGDHVLIKLRQTNIKKLKETFSTLDSDYPQDKKLSEFSAYSFSTSNYGGAIREFSMILYLATIITFDEHEDLLATLESHLDRWHDKRSPGSDMKNSLLPAQLAATLQYMLSEILDDLSKRIERSAHTGDTAKFLKSKIQSKLDTCDIVEYWQACFNAQNLTHQNNSVKRMQENLAGQRKKQPYSAAPAAGGGFRSTPYQGSTPPTTAVAQDGDPLAIEATPVDFDPSTIHGSFGLNVALDSAGGKDPNSPPPKDVALEKRIREEINDAFLNSGADCNDRESHKPFNAKTKYRASFIMLQVKNKNGENLPICYQKRPISNHYGYCGVHGYSCHHGTNTCTLRDAINSSLHPAFTITRKGSAPKGKGNGKGKGKGKRSK